MKKLFFYILSLCCLLTIMSCSSQPKIGVVFGGGGAKGAAEVGALKVLEQAGIKPDYVAGTSMGAVIGGLYAAGYTADEIEQMLLEEEWMWVFHKKKILSFLSDERYPTGLINAHYFRKQMDEALSRKGAHLFHHMKIPFACVTTDLSNGSFKEVDWTEGVVAEAIRISMAYPAPGNAPIYIDGMALADGGIVNNLPVDVVRKMGADIVIAIDLEQDGNNFNLGIPTVGMITKWLNTHPDDSTRQRNIQDADIYIHPDLKGFSIKDYNRDRLSEMIQIGKDAAMEHYKELVDIAK